MMSLAHIFTGIRPDFESIRRRLGKRSSGQKEVEKDAPIEDSSCASPRAYSSTASDKCVQDTRLREAEDDRWLQVESGSPKRWRSCESCAFLSPANKPECEVCGMLGPVIPAAVELSESPKARRTRESTPRTSYDSLNEVVVADKPRSEDVGEVSRHNVILAIFRGLDRRQRGRLGPEELHRFSMLAGFAGPEDGSEWTREYVDMADKYGFAAMTGANYQLFRTCVDDVQGKWYCSNSALLFFLARLDRQDGLTGPKTHTALALLLGRAPLEDDIAPVPAAEKRVEQEAASDGSASEQSDGEEQRDTEEQSDDGPPSFIPGTLDEAPPVDSQLLVLYDDDLWYVARCIRVESLTLAEVEYEDGTSEVLDLNEHAVRMADYESEYAGSNPGDEQEDEKQAADEQEDDDQASTDNVGGPELGPTGAAATSAGKANSKNDGWEFSSSEEEAGRGVPVKGPAKDGWEFSESDDEEDGTGSSDEASGSDTGSEEASGSEQASDSQDETGNAKIDFSTSSQSRSASSQDQWVAAPVAPPARAIYMSSESPRGASKDAGEVEEMYDDPSLLDIAKSSSLRSAGWGNEATARPVSPMEIEKDASAPMPAPTLTLLEKSPLPAKLATGRASIHPQHCYSFGI